MSGSAPIADMTMRSSGTTRGAILRPEHMQQCAQQTLRLFDHLVGERKQIVGNAYAKGLGSLRAGFAKLESGGFPKWFG